MAGGREKAQKVLSFFSFFFFVLKQGMLCKMETAPGQWRACISVWVGEGVWSIAV